jgi:anthranilate phosphoribosyltransferase
VIAFQWLVKEVVMIKDAIAKTIRREDLTQAEAEAAMMEIMQVMPRRRRSGHISSHCG